MRVMEAVAATLARAARMVAGMEGVAKLLLVSVPGASPAILRACGARIGRRAVIHSPLVLVNPPATLETLQIGDDCHLGKDTLIDLAAGVSLGDRVTVSMGARLISHLDVGMSALAQAGFERRAAPVRLESDVYVGANAVILHGVTVGRCSVIGAGAVVTRDVPPFSVAVGVPAKVVRQVDMSAGTGAATARAER
jgi:acetyltransferase-like isoleucine patch superfamily enzyme